MPLNATQLAHWTNQLNVKGVNIVDGGIEITGGTSATAVAIIDADTIATAGLTVTRINPAAARAALILEAGTYDQQRITVVNVAAAANTATFAAAPGSNVADGVASVVAGLTCATFVWLVSTALWYHEV